MIYGLLIFVHLIVSVLLIISILLQSSKGGGLAGAFGGGGQSNAFSGPTTATFLNKATIVLGTVFFVNAVLLGIVGRGGAENINSSVMDEIQSAQGTETFLPAINTSSSQQASPAVPVANPASESAKPDDSEKDSGE